MRSQAKLRISLLLIAILSVTTVGLNSWPVYAHGPDNTPSPEIDTTSTPDPTNNSADEEGDPERSMPDMGMDDAALMLRMVHHCEMMAMMMQMMMDGDSSEQDMQGMMGRSTERDTRPEQDMGDMMRMMSDPDMMTIMMQMMNGATNEDPSDGTNMHGMGGGDE